MSRPAEIMISKGSKKSIAIPVNRSLASNAVPELHRAAEEKTAAEVAVTGSFRSIKFDFIKYFLDKNYPAPKPDSFNKDMFDLLFFDFLSYIKIKQWIYATPKTEADRCKNVLAADAQKKLVVNCFDLSKAFLGLLQELGIKTARLVEYHHEFSKVMGVQHGGLSGPFECFDPTARSFYLRRNNKFQFARHCVVELQLPINGQMIPYYYDLTFQCIYQDLLAPYDRSPKALVFKAASENDFAKVQELMSQMKYDFNQHDGVGHWTLLHWASYRNNLDAVQSLVTKVNPNLKDVYGRLAFQLTSDKRISERLRAHSDPHVVREIDVQTKLMPSAIAAIKVNDRKTLADLFRLGLGVSDFDPKTGRTLLHCAAIENQFDMVIYLVLKGVCPDTRDKKGKAAVAYTTVPPIRTYLETFQQEIPYQPPLILTKKRSSKMLGDKTTDATIPLDNKRLKLLTG